MADGIIASDYEVSVSLKISKLARDIMGGAAIGLRAHTDPLLELITEYFKRNERNKDYRIFLTRGSRGSN